MKVSALIDALLQLPQDAELFEFDGPNLRPTSYEPEMVGLNDKDKECSFETAEKIGIVMRRS